MNTVKLFLQDTSVIEESKPDLDLPLLDHLIPYKDHHKPYNHPFLYDTEITYIQNRYQSRMKIWNKCISMTTDEDSLIDGSCEDGPPVLEKVEPVIPVTSCNSTPPMPEIQKKQLKTVPPSADNTDDSNLSKCGDAKKLKRRSHRKAKPRVSSAPDIMDTDSLDKSEDISVKHMRSLGNYFCAFDKTDKNGYGHGFYMMGKCVDEEGQVNYMIKWDQ